MAGDAQALMILLRGIVAGDAIAVARSLAATPALASSSFQPQGAMGPATHDYFLDEISHHLYAGDTPLHVAAAAHRKAIVAKLLSMGADVRARNRRGAQPLHYAADGIPGSAHWDPNAQRDTVVALLEAGADPNALIEGGADVGRPNGSGSTPIQLAHWATGRGGSGSSIAKAEQKVIVRLLLEHGAG